MIKKVKTVDFTSGRYKLVFDNGVVGWCDQPDHLTGQPVELKIWIKGTLRGRELLETLIHEGLHAEFPKMTEKEVDAAGRHLATMLWRLGYRLKGK